MNKYDEDDIKWVTINGNHIPLTESVKKKIKDGTLFKDKNKSDNKQENETSKKEAKAKLDKAKKEYINKSTDENWNEYLKAKEEYDKYKRPTKFNEKEYKKYVETKESGDYKAYTSEWRKLEEKYGKKYQEEYGEKNDKKWYYSVKSDPSWEDKVKDNGYFKRLEEKYGKEYEEYSNKNSKKTNDRIAKTIEAKEKAKAVDKDMYEDSGFDKSENKKQNISKNEAISDKEIKNYKPKHLYDVGYVPESKILKEANKYDLYTTNKTMADGIEIGDNDKEGLKDIGGSTVSYTMSNDRYYNLSKEEKNAISKINQNNKEAEKLEVQNTEIINKKSSRKDWYEHLGEASKHTHETKSGKDYYDELDQKDKSKIIVNDKKIEELKEDSIKQAKILDNGPTYGKYPLGQDKNKNISDTKIGDKISKKQKASGIIMLDNDKVLLVEHSDGRFGYPKGHIDKGESEKDAAIREVFEETNYNAKIKDGIRIPIKYSDKNGETREEVYYVGNISSKNKNKIKTGELKGAKFYSLDEAREKLKDYGNLIRVLDKATGESKEDTKPVKYNTLSDYEEYFRSIGYSKAVALKMAKEIINKRKKN